MKYIRKICIYMVMIQTVLFVHIRSYADDTKTKPDEIPLTLDTAIRVALQNNRSLLGSAASIESRELSLLSTKSEFDLKIIPSTSAGISDENENFGAGISLEKKFSFGPRAVLSPGFVRSSDSYSGRVATSLSIPILRGFGREISQDAIRRSQYSLRAGKRNFYIQQVNITLDTVSAFYDIIKQEEMVRLSDTDVEKLSQHSELAKIKEKVGLATPIDIFRAEIRMKDVEDQRAIARENLRNAKDRLKLILSLPLDSDLNISADMEKDKIIMSPEEAVEIAMKNRIELEQYQDEIREARKQSDIAEHNLLPQLDLVLEYDRFASAEDIENSLRFDDERWSLRFVSATDWARTSEKTNYRQSLINIRTSRLNLETKQEEIKREVRRQLEALQKAEERMEIRQEQIRQAEGKLALAKIKFNHNMADNFDVIEAETEFRQARVNLLSVEIDYIVGIYRLRAVLGTLIER